MSSGGTAVARTQSLALVFQELLTVIVRIRAGRQPVTDAEVFRAQVRDSLAKAEDSAVRAGYSKEDARLGLLAIVAFLDETVLASSNPVFRDWPRQPLGPDYFGKFVAGESFFLYLRDLLTAEDSHRVADILEVYQLCLLLGYRGKFGAGREGDLQMVTNRVAEKIYRIRGASPWIVPPVERQEAVILDKDPWSRRILMGAGAFCVLALVLFFAYMIMLSSAVSSVRSA
ncbi:MAG: DotU family type IV/VI secretion system protein [Bryobacteraceae bacterium]